MDYRIVRVEHKNIQLHSDLLSKVFSDTPKYSTSFLKWQYYDNPAGNVVGFDAFYGEELAAHYVTIPVIYLYDNKQVRGLLSLNTATGKAHQGKGLFLQLAKATYDLAQKEGYRFVAGVANQNSTHGFLKKLDFSLISQLDVKVYLGKSWAAKNNPGLFRSFWDQGLVNWRLANPEGHYFKKGNALYSKTHLPFIKSLMTTNTLFVRNKLKKGGFMPVNLSIGLNLGKPQLAIDLPERLKPSPLNLIFRDLSSEKLNVTKDNFYFELIDFDAY